MLQSQFHMLPDVDMKDNHQFHASTEICENIQVSPSTCSSMSSVHKACMDIKTLRAQVLALSKKFDDLLTQNKSQISVHPSSSHHCSDGGSDECASNITVMEDSIKICEVGEEVE